MFALFGSFLKLVDLPADNARERQMAALFGDIVELYDWNEDTGLLWEDPVAAMAIQHTTVVAAVLFVLLCLLSMMMQYSRPTVKCPGWLLRFNVRNCSARVWAALSPTSISGACESIVNWFWNPLNPEDSLLHCFLAFCVMPLLADRLLRPVLLCLTGVSEGLRAVSLEHSPYCWDMTDPYHRLGVSHAVDRWWYCQGEGLSLEARALFGDFLDWPTSSHLDEDNMRHLPILFTGLLVYGAILFVGWFFHRAAVQHQLLSQEELIEKMFEYSDVIQDNEAFLSRWSHTVNELKELIVALNGLLASALTHIRRLTNQEDRLQKQVDSYNSTLCQLRMENSHLKHANNELRFDIMDMKDDAIHYPYNPSDIRKLHEQLAASNHKVVTALQESQSLREKYERTQRELTAVNAECVSARKSIVAAANDLTAEQNRSNLYWQNGTLLEQRYLQLQSEYSQLQREKCALETSIQQSLVVTERDEAVSRANSAQAERDQAVSRIGSLEAELANSTAQLVTARQALEKRSDSPKADVQADAPSVDKRKTKRLQAARRRAFNLKDERDTMRDRLDTSQEQVENLDQSLREFHRNNQALEQRLAETDSQASTQIIPVRKDENQAQRALLDRKTQEIVLQKAEIDSLNAQVEQLQQARERQQPDASLQAHVDTLKVELEASKRARTEEQLASNRRITELENNVKSLELKESNRNLFSGRGRGTSPLRAPGNPFLAPPRRGR
jgi:hypothetical protein